VTKKKERNRKGKEKEKVEGGKLSIDQVGDLKRKPTCSRGSTSRGKKAKGCSPDKERKKILFRARKYGKGEGRSGRGIAVKQKKDFRAKLKKKTS